MKLNEKRKVIEVLLCSATDPFPPWGGITTWHAISLLGKGYASVRDQADDAWHAAYEAFGGVLTHGYTCLEAAYMLIESSPTLRREWFGR